MVVIARFSFLKSINEINHGEDKYSSGDDVVTHRFK